MYLENVVLNAIDIVLFWDVSETSLGDAVFAQSKLMCGIYTD